MTLLLTSLSSYPLSSLCPWLVPTPPRGLRWAPLAPASAAHFSPQDGTSVSFPSGIFLSPLAPLRCLSSCGIRAYAVVAALVPVVVTGAVHALHALWPRSWQGPVLSLFPALQVHGCPSRPVWAYSSFHLVCGVPLQWPLRPRAKKVSASCGTVPTAMAQVYCIFSSGIRKRRTS